MDYNECAPQPHNKANCHINCAFYITHCMQWTHAYVQWRRLGAEFVGTENFFRTWMTFFPEKISIFTPKIYDDLFLVIDQVFRFFTVLNTVYDPFFTRKTTISEKNSFMSPLLLCSYFRARPTTLLLKILGDGCMGGSPLEILGGTVPPVPLGLRLWRRVEMDTGRLT